MIGSGVLPLIATVAAGGAVVAIVALWFINYRQTDDIEDATDQTSRTVIGVVSGGIFALVIALGNFAGLFGTLGDIVSTWPGAVGQFVLGRLAVAGFAGWIELGAVGATILVVGIIVAVAGIRN
jgi:hypothetical protein